MKKRNLLSSILLVSLSSFSLIARGQNTILSGELKGLSGGTVEITYNKNGVRKADTITAVNDNFTWKANLNEPQLIGLTIDHNSNSIFVGPGHITLKGVKKSGQPFIITGSPAQKDAETFGASIEGLTREQRESAVTQFITDHPKSFFSLYMVTGRASFSTGYNEMKPMYDKLDKSLKQTESGKKLTQMMEILKKSRLGTQMTDFTQRDTSGNPVRFNSFKGKYVLVDFWASWCGPCRAENPNVLKAYNAFKDKGFTVVGISLDDKAANWKKAIRDDKMPWIQLSDLKGWKNEVSTDFGIQSIPGNLLIDPSGKIVAKDLRGTMLEEKLNELLK
jgi:peroxiredoxin